ncbi:hypothetical protein BGAL_0181g00060 [Botrytis galanthina]|uniref:Uncharacterized protein n=1 Tax=Botrytis galanthina TaxID=278940 RepID=A0A4S8QWL3_9HELO|nr:hypothetical protein BGAL_0181g00060 [Botrytis galanthina]
MRIQKKNGKNSMTYTNKPPNFKVLAKIGSNKPTWAHTPSLCTYVSLDKIGISAYLVAMSGQRMLTYSNQNCNPGTNGEDGLGDIDMENQGDMLCSETGLGGISAALLSELMEFCCRSQEDPYTVDETKIEEDTLILPLVDNEITFSPLSPQNQPITNKKPDEVLNLDIVDNEIAFSPHPPHRNSMAAIPPHQPHVNLNFGQHRFDPGAGNFYPQPHLPYSALDHAPPNLYQVHQPYQSFSNQNHLDPNQGKQRLGPGPIGTTVPLSNHMISPSPPSLTTWNLTNPGKFQYENKCLKAHVKWTCWELMRNGICNDATTSHRQMHEQVQDMDNRRFLFESIHGHAANPRFPETQQIPRLKAH